MKSTRNLIKTISILLFCLIAAASTAQNQTVTLTVLVSGAKPGSGQALFSLFDSKKSFLKTPLISREALISATGGAEFIITDLSPGVYAVTVIHDEDSSGELNTGFLGIPTEKVGMSNNPTARFGPPGFRKASFELDQSMTLEIFLEGLE